MITQGQSSNQSQSDNTQQQPIVEEVDEEEQSRLNEKISEKFYRLSAAIKVSFDDTFNLIGRRQETRKGIRGKTTYFILNKEEDDIFNQELMTVNENLGTARTILDSYISFSKSVPDFEKFFNKFYTIYKTYITNHRKTLFFRLNAEQSKYMYPYYEIHDGLQELGFLFSRLCGTLGIAGDYIRNPPSTPRAPSFMGGGGEGDRAYRPIGDYYGAPWEQWRNMYGEKDDYMKGAKRKYQDFGGMEDK